MATCLYLINRSGGGVATHESVCAFRHWHKYGGTEEEKATHHGLFGVSKERPNGSSCANLCNFCSKKAEKFGIVTEGIIQ